MSEPSIPKAHSLLIPESEAQLLGDIIGHRLERIRVDGLSASLEFDSCVLVACPEPGLGGSPAFPNREEIMRLFVRLVTAEESARLHSSRHTQVDLGKRVRDIHLLHSLLVLTEAVEVGPQRLTDSVELPAGLGYDVVCIHPSRVAWEQLEQLIRRGCANFVDIGIMISLEEADPVVIRTDGSSWRVLVSHEGNSSAYQEIAAPVPLSDRSARPLSGRPPSC